MNKKDSKIIGDSPSLFPKLKSYSVDEILAAGGTTAFANKMGKSAQSLLDYLKEIPKEDFLTEEEYLSALKTLNQSK
jgi:hypothetical protein